MRQAIAEAVSDAKEKALDCYYAQRRLLGRLRRVFRWLPVLWRDFDGDWAAIFLVWEFRLREGARHIREHNLIEDAEKVASEMETCAAALCRLAEDDYAREEWERHRSRFPPRRAERLADGRYCLEPMSDEEAASLEALVRIEEAMRAADEKLFAETLIKNYRGWWD